MKTLKSKLGNFVATLRMSRGASTRAKALLDRPSGSCVACAVASRCRMNCFLLLVCTYTARSRFSSWMVAVCVHAGGNMAPHYGGLLCISGRFTRCAVLPRIALGVVCFHIRL